MPNDGRLVEMARSYIYSRYRALLEVTAVQVLTIRARARLLAEGVHVRSNELEEVAVDIRNLVWQRPAAHEYQPGIHGSYRRSLPILVDLITTAEGFEYRRIGDNKRPGRFAGHHGGFLDHAIGRPDAAQMMSYLRTAASGGVNALTTVARLPVRKRASEMRKRFQTWADQRGRLMPRIMFGPLLLEDIVTEECKSRPRRCLRLAAFFRSSSLLTRRTGEPLAAFARTSGGVDIWDDSRLEGVIDRRDLTARNLPEVEEAWVRWTEADRSVGGDG